MPPEAPRGRGSLFVEILDWMLLPLLVVWSSSIVVTYFVARPIATAPFDRLLQDRVHALAADLGASGGDRPGIMGPATRVILEGDGVDVVRFQVRRPDGSVLTGDGAIPPRLRETDEAPGVVYFRDGILGAEEVRIAYMFLPSARGGPELLVQVAETLHRRDRLAQEFVTGIVVPQFMLMPAAVILVWIGLSRGLRPISGLWRSIRARPPGDLSAIDESIAPQEILPLIHSINDLMARLDRSLQAQRRFVSDAAHQLRTPLAGLRTQAEVALRQRDLPEIHDSLRQVVASTARTEHLVNQLLSLARAEAPGEVLPAFGGVDLAALARECVEEALPSALAKEIDLGFEDAGESLTVQGVGSLLRELMRNLIDNAIKYTPGGGRVTVRTATGGSPVLEVEDSGPGIPPPERELVFQRFYRVLGVGTHGSGLGLAIVREIADLHGATVSLTDAPNPPGTLFRVAFAPLKTPSGAGGSPSDAFPLA